MCFENISDFSLVPGGKKINKLHVMFYCIVATHYICS